MSTADQFFQAIRDGNTGRVTELLQETPALINETTGEGISPILFAVYVNRRDIVDLLLPHKPELDLFEAAAVGDEQIIKILTVEYPEEISGFSPDGFTPLHLAAFFGHADIAFTLVDRGAEVNIRAKNPSAVTPLNSALAHRNPAVAAEIAEILIRQGADVNAAQEGGWRPLHQAAAQGFEDLVRLLIKHGADRSCKSDDGKTPAEMAREKNFTPVVEILETA